MFNCKVCEIKDSPMDIEKGRMLSSCVSLAEHYGFLAMVIVQIYFWIATLFMNTIYHIYLEKLRPIYRIHYRTIHKYISKYIHKFTQVNCLIFLHGTQI